MLGIKWKEEKEKKKTIPSQQLLCHSRIYELGRVAICFKPKDMSFN